MPKPLDVERRASEHGLVQKGAKDPVDRDRRRTLGATPGNFNASKHHAAVHLGSAPSAYYFGDTPGKKHHHHTPGKKHHHTPAKPQTPAADATVDLGNVSMLSEGTSSSEESDLLNKSILSDTTELTASNFVLQASSRQRLLELTRAAKETENVALPQNQQFDTTTTSPSQGREKRVSFQEFGKTPAKMKQNETTIELSTQKSLDSLLDNLKEDAKLLHGQANSTSSQDVQGGGLSPSSSIATSTSLLRTSASKSKLTPFRLSGTPERIVNRERRAATPHPGNDSSELSSPTGTNAEEESHFRLTPGSQNKNLTPTKLSHRSPRRVPNPESFDSPARNTRNAQRTSSPMAPAGLKMDVEMKRSPEEELATAFLTIRKTSRVSELTMPPTDSPIPKRIRRSSTSTADPDDFDGLLGLTEPEKEEKAPQEASANARRTSVPPPGSRRTSFAPSPATVSSVPKSILSSSNRSVPGSHSRKSVVFGSPEAAEYRVGSPSVSLTPMPKDAAKAMFSMSSVHGSDSSSSVESLSDLIMADDEDDTVEIEADMGSLLQNISGVVENLPDSEAKLLAEVDTEELAKRTLEDLLPTKSAGGASETTLSVSESSVPKSNEDDTVELEGSIQGMLSNILGSPSSMLLSEQKKSSGEVKASAADSMDMTDSVSTASRTHQDKSDEAAPQVLDFEPSHSSCLDGSPEENTPDFTTGQGGDEDNTVELEADLASLLSTQDRIPTARQTPKPVALTEKFPKMDSSLVRNTNRLSFGEAMKEPTELNEKVDMTVGSVEDAMEETITRELEPNMDSLVLATDETNTPSASRRRSSHRFSLTPSRRQSFSSTALDVSMTIDEESEESGDYAFVSIKKAMVVEERPRENKEDEQILELGSKEIMEAAGLPSSASALRKKNASDTLASANTASKNFRNALIAEAMNGFVYAVCGEIENKAEMSSDGSSSFDTIVNESPEQLLMLQRALWSRDEHVATKSKAELARLAKTVHEFVDFEWKSWEAQVIESMAQTVDGIAIEFEESDQRLESSITLADDALEAVSLMEGKAVRKARRRSMNRRVTTSQVIEIEMRELEQEIARERANLEAVQSKQRTAAAFQKVLSDLYTLFEESSQSRARAESLQNKFMSLNGMHCWSPLGIGESQIDVGFIGACPKTCIKVSFFFEKNGSVSCHANVDRVFYRQRRSKKLKLTSATSLLVESNIKTLIDAVNEIRLKSGSNIGEFLHRLEMLHGRLEMTANEVFVLQKRFGTLLEADPFGKASAFLLSVDFKSLRGPTALRATFELNSSYPFAPMKVSLDDPQEKIDVESLRRQLLKNAKPGFGYLSRTCDTISAFLR